MSRSKRASVKVAWIAGGLLLLALVLFGVYRARHLQSETQKLEQERLAAKMKHEQVEKDLAERQRLQKLEEEEKLRKAKEEQLKKEKELEDLRKEHEKAERLRKE
eukprot:140614_1